jgi:hypothetical protein
LSIKALDIGDKEVEGISGNDNGLLRSLDVLLSDETL